MLTVGIIILGAPTAIGTLEKPTLFHELAGYAVFLVALAGMLLIARLLSTTRDEWRSVGNEVRNSTTASAPPRSAQSDLY